MIQQRSMPGSTNRILYVSICLLMTTSIFFMLFLKPSNKQNSILFENVEHYTSYSGLKLWLQNARPSTFHFRNFSNTPKHKKYLVYSSKCKIPNLNPFNLEIMKFYTSKRYIKCTNKPLLTYLTKKNNVAILHLDERNKDYYGRGIYCYFSYIWRGKTDDDIKKDAPVKFRGDVVLKHSTVLVICLDENSHQVYRNLHTTILINDKVEKKLKKQKNKQPLSVLFIGIDSISRMNLLRSLPKTHVFLQKNNWLEFEGYNKIADNTFPNLMAILTGLNQTTAFKVCNPKVLGMLDKCNLIWYDFKKLGFVTAFAEDQAGLNTFNHYKKGFKQEPTDYYLRSYIYGLERFLDRKLVDHMSFCTGPENSGERIFNIARDFTSTFKNYSTFSLFWMNSYSHGNVNAASRMDEKLLNFLKDLTEAKIVDNSIVILLSDHGFRIGEVTHTYAGWLEERLPFFYMLLPKWFKRKYPEKHMNLVKNKNKLTTPYDLHMTLQEILILSGNNYTVKQSSGCPNCKSLFSEIETERSCQEAGIPIRWCTCRGYFFMSSKILLAKEGAKFIIGEIHEVLSNSISDTDKCVNFELNEVVSAAISDTFNVTKQDIAYLLVIFKTYPKAVFQGTLRVNLKASMPTFQMHGSITRLDFNEENSRCVNNGSLKRYCYCNETLNYYYDSFWFIVDKIRYSPTNFISELRTRGQRCHRF